MNDRTRIVIVGGGRGPTGRSSTSSRKPRATASASSRGFLVGVDRYTRSVSLKSIEADPPAGAGATSLPYDMLVLAIGSRANDFGTPGVAEHCATIDDLMEAEAFRGRLRRRLLATLDSRSRAVRVFCRLSPKASRGRRHARCPVSA